MRRTLVRSVLWATFIEADFIVPSINIKQIMERLLAYFDILGFREFIDNNKDDYVDRFINNLFRDSQSAVSGDNYVDGRPGTYFPDLSKSKIHCIHISDSIIFWTEDISLESFNNIVECASLFLTRSIYGIFPVRGCIVAGHITFEPSTIKNDKGFLFHKSLLYGKAIIAAYLKAEFQDWAGCYIDKSATSKFDEKVISDLIDSNKIVYYPIPLKDGSYSYEYTLRTVSGTLNNVAFKNFAKNIEEIFMMHMNGKEINESAKRKLTNTIKFLNYFRQDTVP